MVSAPITQLCFSNLGKIKCKKQQHYLFDLSFAVS